MFSFGQWGPSHMAKSISETLMNNEPAFYWEDSHLAELVRDAERARKTFRQLLVEELLWWLKCGCVIACTALAAYLVGWGLAMVSK